MAETLSSQCRVHSFVIGTTPQQHGRACKLARHAQQGERVPSRDAGGLQQAAAALPGKVSAENTWVGIGHAPVNFPGSSCIW